ncbi:hypothetical protein Tcan_10323 [Toxocara canis]|uniref:Uncharacterized protein n=1 Tax=Toxocara canis TaxID=6265 RepID=A0A0B2VWQ0_TOXCA|nr:hypothetical protein Tcan_10323 [Toxocara canis]
MPHSHSIPSGPFDFPWPTQPNGEPQPRAPSGENWPTGPDGKPLPRGPNGLRWPTGPSGKPLPVSPMGTPWPVGPNGGLLPSGPGVEPWPKGWPRLPHIHILPIGPFDFPSHGLVDGNPDLLADMKNHKPTSPPWYPTTIRTVELNWTTPSKPDRLYFGPTRMGPLAELVPFEPPKKNGPDSGPVTPSGKHMRPQFPLWDSNGSEKKEANDAKPEVGKDYSPLYSPEVCEDKAPREVCEMVAPICIDTKAAFILEMIKCKAQQRAQPVNQKAISWIRRAKTVASFTTVVELSAWINETSEIKAAYANDDLIAEEIQHLYRIAHLTGDNACDDLLARIDI